MNEPKKLYRSKSNRRIAGVCGGLAEYLNTDATAIRVLLVLFSLLPGPSIIFYVIAWILIPEEPAQKLA